MDRLDKTHAHILRQHPPRGDAMTGPLQPWGPVRDPIEAIVQTAGAAVLAVITGVEGPSYRPVGATMAFLADGTRIGSLSSGCIESDLALHAKAALAAGSPSVIRYGRGSPFRDLQLPCGGGLEILLLPRPDTSALQQVLDHRRARRPCTLQIHRETGALRVNEPERAGDPLVEQVDFQPGIRFLIFGKGPEASTFATLVQSAAFENTLFSPDQETLDHVRTAGCATHHLKKPVFPDSVAIDDWTAVVLFFHDHEMEPEILATALASPAFYIGAQGSQRARDARHLELKAIGVAPDALARLKGPIGLIASARDPRTLAVSVLAEILDRAMARGLLRGR